MKYRFAFVAAVAVWTALASLIPQGNADSEKHTFSKLAEAVQLAAAAPDTHTRKEQLRGGMTPDKKEIIDSDKRPPASLIGWYEDVQLVDEKVVLKSVMHTGVIVSALNVPAFESFVRSGSIWVRFSVQNATGNAVTLERPVVSFYRLRSENVPDKKRPIVQLKICVAGKVVTADFILWDRAPKGNSIIFGRSFLAGRFLVDASRKFVGSGLCK